MCRLKYFLSISILVVLIIFKGCEPAFEERNPSPGEADFTRYVAVGNSLTAGFANNALYREGQLRSFPNLLSQKMRDAGGGPFNQPLVEPGVGSGEQGNARLVLDVTPDGGLAPVPAAEEGQDIFSEPIGHQGPFNNLGVPGAKVFHLLGDEYATQNPFFGRFASREDITVLEQALELEPTFFTIWIGNNDILSWATAGGTGNADGGTGSNDITSDELFSSSIEALVNQLTSQGADGIVINIPEITTIPFFNVVPWNALELTEEQAQQLREGYEQELRILPPDDRENFVPEFQEGANGFIIEDPDREDAFFEDLEFRMATEEDKILFTIPQDSLQPPPNGPGWGSAEPIPDQYTLRKPQVEIAEQTIDRFNEIINSTASDYDLPVLDVVELLERAESGIQFDGAELTTEFVTGGLFSLDGIHLTDRGNAQLTNEVIELINAEYDATLSPVNVGDYQGVRFP